MESGESESTHIVENDPIFGFPDGDRLDRAFENLELLVLLDCLPSQAARHAQVFLPTTTVFECSSTFINQEGRLQYAARVHPCGSPILETGGGTHPARVYGLGIPGSDPMNACELLAKIGALLCPEAEEDLGNPFRIIAGDTPGLSHLSDLPYPSDGVRTVGQSGVEEDGVGLSRAQREPGSEDHFDLLLVERTFGTEALSCFSEICREVEEEPCLTMHPEDAAGRFAEGDMVRLHAERGYLDVRLELSAKMARKTLVLPRHRRLAWQKFTGSGMKLPLDRIEKL